MFEGNLAQTVGKLGEYGPFEAPGKGEIVFGIFDKNVSGTLIGKELATFKMKASRTASRWPKAEAKMVELGYSADSHKIMAILM